MSVFAFNVDRGILHVCADVKTVSDRCRSEEVRAQAWLFFDKDGSPMRPEFLGSAPDSEYFLRPWASCASCSLPQILHLVTTVEGSSDLPDAQAVARRIGVSGRHRERDD